MNFGDYNVMKCKKQRKYYKLPIASLWEVHLDANLWRRVTRAAKGKKCSFSWITRYCVFRLVRKKNLYMRKAMKIHSNKIKSQPKSQNPHRHILCLYGDDEKLLRLAAMQLGVTVSHMIRLALYWFLPKIEDSKSKWEHIYYHGTKICSYLYISRTNILKMPFTELTFYEKWSFEQWWNRPPVTIPIPYSPS